MRIRAMFATFALVILLCSSLVVWVEAASMWSMTLEGAGKDRLYSVVHTSDGGYAAVGHSGLSGVVDYDVYLFKIDSAGNMEWNKTYGGAGNDRAYSVVQTNDGGYAIAGSTNSSGVGGLDFYLVKTDSAGNMEWNKTYGGAGNDVAYSVVQTSSGRYVITGGTFSFGRGDGDIYWIATNSAGDRVWNKTYGGWALDRGLSVMETADLGYVIGGFTWSDVTTSLDFYLLKIDSAGNMSWSRTYGGEENDVMSCAVQTTDGGYAIVGGALSYGAGGIDFYLVKTDSAGNMIWNKTYGGAGSEIPYSVVQTNDGGYALTGYTTSFGHSIADGYLVKTDAAGNMMWNKTYGGENTDVLRSIVQATDGGYLMVGEFDSWPSVEDDFWLVKVDEFGVVPEFSSLLIPLVVLTASAFVLAKKMKLFRKRS